jgi:hypothetical protein
MTASYDEESPSITGQRCRLITGEGDFKESATEINRIYYVCKDGKAR